MVKASAALETGLSTVPSSVANRFVFRSTVAANVSSGPEKLSGTVTASAARLEIKTTSTIEPTILKFCSAAKLPWETNCERHSEYD